MKNARENAFSGKNSFLLYTNLCQRDRKLSDGCASYPVPAFTNLVKGWCQDVNLKGNYGSHTLRKTWGYWQYKRGVPLPLLMEAFGHATQQQTLGYLCIQSRDIKQIYDLEL